MDGDRPVADGRDIFESKLQALVWEAFCEGWTFGDEDLPDPECCGYAETTEAHERYDKRIHELLISYLDGPTGDVGAQDESSEEGAMGDGVRKEEYIERWYEGEIPEGWKKSPNAIASDFLDNIPGNIGVYKTPGR